MLNVFIIYGVAILIGACIYIDRKKRGNKNEKSYIY